MKQPRYKAKGPMAKAPSPNQAIAMEFARIGRLAESGKISEAWRAANVLYEQHPNNPLANFAVAVILVQNKQNSDAQRFAEAAVKHAPNNVGYLVFLGKLYVDLGLIELAPAVLDKALAIDKTLFQAPRALAQYFQESGQGHRALPHYDQALQLAPEAAKNPIRYERAACLAAIGRLEESEAEFLRVGDQPDLRVKTLARVALLRKNDHLSVYADQVRKMIETPGLKDDERSSLLLCLGRLHENGLDYDVAFQHFEASRKLVRSNKGIEAFRSHVNDAISVVTRETIEKLRDFGHRSEKPIFVVGMPRSGTTMMEQIVASHSQAEGVGELPRMKLMSDNFSAGLGMRGVLAKMAEFGPERWQEIPRQYLNLLNALAPGAPRTVDKMPHNFMHIGFIHLCFPNAKIIHCKRNPLDNFVSAFQNELSPFHSYSYDQCTYGEYYVEYLRLMEHWKSLLAKNIYETQYELLTENPELEIRKVLDFLGLQWEDSCLKFNERESTVKTLSFSQVRSPVNTRSVARWRHYERHLGPIITILEKAGVHF